MWKNTQASCVKEGVTFHEMVELCIDCTFYFLFILFRLFSCLVFLFFFYILIHYINEHTIAMPSGNKMEYPFYLITRQNAFNEIVQTHSMVEFRHIRNFL